MSSFRLGFHLWMLAAALIICGMTTMFTSCSNNDDKSATGNGLAEKVTGKWMLVDSVCKESPFSVVFTSTTVKSCSLAVSLK